MCPPLGNDLPRFVHFSVIRMAIKGAPGNIQVTLSQQCRKGHKIVTCYMQPTKCFVTEYSAQFSSIKQDNSRIFTKTQMWVKSRDVSEINKP